MTDTASHVDADVLLQNRLQLLVGVSPLDDELILSIERSIGAKLAQNEAQHMLVLSVHLVAVVHEVDPAGLCGTNASHLRQRHCVFLVTSKLGIIRLNLLIDTVEDLCITNQREKYINILVVLISGSLCFHKRRNL